MQPEHFNRYGVIEQTACETEIDYACESLRHLGYAVINAGYGSGWLQALSNAFEHAQQLHYSQHGGVDMLKAIDEHNTIRLPLAYEPMFLELANNASVIQICRRLIGGYLILNQQNGVINPPHSERYNQGAWHRDLPYQHFVSSRPLAINALFCLDPFTRENGATKVLPASHRQEAFPSDRFLESEAVTVSAPSGSFIILDCMVFHSGGVNTTDRPRRAINHVYSIPLLRQQIDLPAALGESFVTNGELRKLLGYDVRTPRSVLEYLASRTQRS